MLAAAPLLILPVLVYHLVLLSLPGGFGAPGAAAEVAAPLFAVPMGSGARWPVSLGDLLVAAALVLLFVELLKPARDRRTAMINHALSLVLFLGCTVELLLMRGFATSPFALITLMALLDAAAGLLVTFGPGRSDG